MKHVNETSRAISRAFATLVVVAAATGAAWSTAAAQTPAKKVLGIDDYSRWRSINSPSLSGDGKWATCVLAYTNVPATDTKPTLFLRQPGNGQELQVPNASAPALSRDPVIVP